MQIRTAPLFAVVAALAVTDAHAQSPSPHPHYGAYEGDLWNVYPFTAASRIQQIHEDRAAAAVFTALHFRRNGDLNGVPHDPVAKSLTLKLVLAPSVALASVTSSFAANYAGTATTVFQNTLSLPTAWQTPPTSSPSSFDMTIAFTAPFPHAGGPFLWDAESSAFSINERVYLDAASSGFSLFAPCAYEMYGQGCTTANGVMTARGIGQNLGGLGQFGYTTRTDGAPANAPGFVAFGAGITSLPVPGLCAPMLVNPLVVLPTANPSDANGVLTAVLLVPSNPVLLGFPVTMQTLAFDPAQTAPLKISISNGLSYRTAPMAPTFQVGHVRQAAGSTSPPTVLTSQAVVVGL